MKNLKKHLSLILVFFFVLTLVPALPVEAVVGVDKIESKEKYENEIVRVIVQLGDKTETDGHSKKSIEGLQERVKSEIENKISGVEFRRNFTLLVNGLSLKTARKNIEAIRKIPGVSSVRESIAYYPAMVAAPKITQAYNTVVSKKATGEGVVVSIIDTGIDINHPDMRLSDFSKAKIKDIKSGFTEKVPYGYNFADLNDNVKDADYKSMHGMHVAGIVAANASDDNYSTYRGIRGVAPEAQLLAMKVFTNNPDDPSCYDDDIIAAIEDSVIHNADIINMSLGSPMGFQDENDPVAKAFTKAKNQGVLVLVAAGNEQIATTSDSYRSGVFNDLGLVDVAVLGQPSTHDDAFSVASMQNNTMLTVYGEYLANGTRNKVFYKNVYGPKTLSSMEKLVDGGIAKTDTLDPAIINGNYVLVERGVATYNEKAKEVIAKGGKGMVLFNSASGVADANGLISPGMGDGIPTDFPVFVIPREAGLALRDSIANKSEASVYFSDLRELTVSDDPLEMSGFSSWGPTQNLDFKPEITAPGGNIYSTMNNGEYDYMSGTSMATPHAAGLSALLWNHAKNLGMANSDLVDFVKISMMNTSKVMMDEYESSGLPYSPRRQGAGLAQIEDALNTKVLVKYEDEGAIALRSFTGNKTVAVTLQNYSDKDYKFTTKSEEVFSQATGPNGNLFVVKADGFTATTDSTEITVPAKGTATVNITINSATTLNNFVEGNVYFHSLDLEQPNLHIPFMGFSGNYGDEDVFEDAVYDNGNVLYGETKMVSRLTLGGDKWITLGDLNAENESDIKASTVAFSPNGDNEFDFAALRMVTLRNVEDIKFEIVDKNDGSETTLRQLNVLDHFRRPVLERYLEKLKKDIDPVYVEDYNYWDGMIYNQRTGNYELAKDGQYFVKMSARVNKDSNWQTKYVPISIDTVKPEVKDAKGILNSDGTYTITFTATDKSGIGIVDKVFIDGVGSDSISNVGDVYTVTFNVAPTTLTSAQINVYDNAFNQTSFVLPLTNTSIQINNIDAIKDSTGLMIDENNNLAITGTATTDIKFVKIGKDEVSSVAMTMNANNTFVGTISLVEGENNLNAYGYGADGKLLATVKLDTIILDKTAPVITITSPVVNNGVATATQDMITIAGKVTDNTQVSSVLVQGVEVELNPNGTFATDIEVPLNRIVYVDAMDIYGNTVTNEIRMIFEKYDDGFTFTNLEGWMFINAKHPDVVSGNSYNARGFVSTKDSQLFINGNPVAIKDDLSFEVNIPMIEGINYLVIKYINNEGTTVYDYKYRIYFDMTAPSFSLETPTIIENKIYTNKDTIDFKGTIYDNTIGYILRINGDLINSFTNWTSTGQIVNQTPFAYVAKNILGGDKMTLELIDALGNMHTEQYTVVFDDVVPIITIENVEEAGIYESGILPVVTFNEPLSAATINLNNQPWDGQAITKAGTYILEVRAVDLAGNVSTKTLKFVVNAKPVIENEEIRIGQGKFTDIKSLIKITDAEDGDISKNAEIIGADKIDYNKPGTYPVTIRVTDSTGQIAEKTINVVVTGVPELVGVADIAISEGAAFDALEGVTAKDLEDGDLTSKIIVTGNVATKTPGVYLIKYSVTDSEGNTTEKEIKVEVKAINVRPGDGVKNPDVVTLIDDMIGGKVIGTTETLNKDWKLVITPIDKQYPNLKVQAYDIKILENGVPVQPRGPITVYIPIENGLLATKLRVFYDDNTKLHELKHLVSNGNAVFEASHFSTYVLANDLEGTNNTNPPSTDKPVLDNSNPLPATGETSNNILILVGIGIIAIAGIFVTNKKKKI